MDKINDIRVTCRLRMLLEILLLLCCECSQFYMGCVEPISSYREVRMTFPAGCNSLCQSHMPQPHGPLTTPQLGVSEPLHGRTDADNTDTSSPSPTPCPCRPSRRAVTHQGQQGQLPLPAERGTNQLTSIQGSASRARHDIQTIWILA